MLFSCKPMSDDDTENSGTENNVSEAPASTPSEGIVGQIDNYFGISKAGSSVEGEIRAGVRSACSYVGARRIKDLPKCTTFVRVNITTNEIYTSLEVS